MRRKKIDAALVSSLANLQAADYTSAPILGDVYKRLENGRNAFAEIYPVSILLFGIICIQLNSKS